MSAFRLSSGDRRREVSFTFNGKKLNGRSGEPLSAALLANGVHLVARSFKYHRPRGIVSAGVEEPSALLQIGTGARSTPNLSATQVRLYEGLVARSQNCSPSVDFDLGGFNQLIAPFIPAGFYYKTFMGLRGRSWMFFEKFIRNAAGLGVAPVGCDPDEYDQINHHCDLLIVGAGPAGLAAAIAASKGGVRVLLVEQDVELGGSLLFERTTATDTIDGKSQLSWLAEARAALAAAPNVTVLTQTCLFGCYRHNWFAAIETLHEAGEIGEMRQRLWRVRAAKTIFATGAIERMMVFENNDRPGVMLASAVRKYAVRHSVAAGRRVLFATNNDSAYQSAIDCKAAGITVAGIVDSRVDCSSEWLRLCAEADIEVLLDSSIERALGGRRVKSCDVITPGGRRRIICDTIAVSGGWTPSIHLHSQLQGALTFRSDDGTFVPTPEIGRPASVGACNGTYGLREAMAEGAANVGEITGQIGPRYCPLVEAPEPVFRGVDWRQPARTSGRVSRCFVDLQNDVTVKDIQIALREGFEINEHLKRYCGIGMGTDQGKTSNLNAMTIAAEIRQISPIDVGLTRYRPPFSPVGLGAMAGHHRGQMLHPYRYSPLHTRHERFGAVFNPTGQWLAVRAYCRNGEAPEDAVRRETTLFSSAVMLDSSHNSKFELTGSDALSILDKLYFTPLSDIAVGEICQSLLLTENGTVSDASLIWRLGTSRFLVIAPPSSGDRLAMHIQSAIQSAGTRTLAFLTEVTDRWAQVGVGGSKAGAAIDALSACSLVVGRRSVSEIPWFELLFPTDAAISVWDKLAEQGALPIGHDAAASLQIEAGIPRLGFEIDGTVNPQDLGWSDIPTKPFVGRDAVLRDLESTIPRRQLVALDSDSGHLMPGSQVLASGHGVPVGYVTSSAVGPSSGKYVNLALVEDGRQRLGQVLRVVAGGRSVQARVTLARGKA